MSSIVCCCCSRRAKAREQIDAHGIIGHALAEIIVMLLRENGRGHEDGDLFPLHDRFERGANGHFSFAVTDVAADQPVHRLGRFHVFFGRDDGPHLVGRFFVDETSFRTRAANGVVGGRDSPACDSRAAWIGSNSLATSRTATLRLRFGFRPTRAAERVQRRTRFAGADIFADEMRFGDRHIKFRRGLVGVARRVFDDETFFARFVEVA